MTLWGNVTTLRSAPGDVLQGSVQDWTGWSGLTLTCSGTHTYDWSDVSGQTAREAGVEEILVNNTDITSDVRVCLEPWNVDAGYRPVVLLGS